MRSNDMRFPLLPGTGQLPTILRVEVQEGKSAGERGDGRFLRPGRFCGVRYAAAARIARAIAAMPLPRLVLNASRRPRFFRNTGSVASISSRRRPE